MNQDCFMEFGTNIKVKSLRLVTRASKMVNLSRLFHLELSRYWGGSSWNGKPDGNFSNYHFWFRTRGFNFGCRICYQDSEEKKQNNNSKNFTLTCHLNV